MTLFPVVNTAKILIADDSLSQRNLLSAILTKMGFTVITAVNGQEVIEMFRKEQPELVILDIVMPVVDGIQAAKEIRLLPTDDYVPIIFVTSAKTQKNLDQCIELGGDDFIDKPFNEEVLCVKIRSLLRMKALYLAQLEQKKKLLNYQEIIEQEQLVAATIYKNILRMGFVEMPILRYSLSPMALFNGDIFLSAKGPGNQLYLLLGDFTGHGLSASVGASPTADIFYGMVRKGFSLIEIVIEINRKLLELLPSNMFLAATAVTLNSDTGLLQLICCGLPDHYLLNKNTYEIRTVNSKNLPLGIIANIEPVVQSLKICNQDYLYLFSDGLIEYENSTGAQFDAANVIECLKSPVESHFDLILDRLQEHSEGFNQKDDVTFVELQCDLSQVCWQKDAEISKQRQRVAMDWKSSMSFTAQSLKYIQPVPIMVNLLMEIQGLQSYQETIFQIVNELFLNALDYGLLGMNGSLKQTAEGLAQYNQIRSQRLNAIQEGDVKFIFTHHAMENGGRLTIRVQDSGNGFDFKTILTKQNNSLHGIHCVKNNCTHLEYLGCGNQVSAVFEWSL